MLLRAYLIGIIGLFILLPKTSTGQSSTAKIKSTADRYFQAQDYRQALNYYVRYNQYKSGVPVVIKRMAICQFNNNQIDKASTNLIGLIESGEAENDAEIYYYYGECLMHQHDFENAAKSYKQFIRKSRPNKRYAEVLHKLKNCSSGTDLIHTKAVGFIENFGPLVNSIEDDIAPLFSVNYNDRIYFASNFDRSEANPLNAKKSLDIYSTELQQGDWADPTLFPKKFSSDQDEIPLDFFQDGKIMYFQRGRFDGAKILIDTFTNDTLAHLASDQFSVSNAPIFPELGDQNILNYGDSMILFSSKRPGGFGGYDIYYSRRSRMGWTKPTNLGQRINSKFDEVDPFLTNNGTTLYFSSNRTTSIGGFDIFKSRYDANTKSWGRTDNAGQPINSAGDDRWLKLSPNGSSVIFSSNRKTGYGGFDLYVMYAENPLGDMSMLRGQLTPGFLMTDLPVDLSELPESIVKQESDDSPDEVLIEEIIQPELVVDPNIYPPKKINVASIYYSESDVVLNPQSLRELDKLADLLRLYPLLTIKLFSHSSGYDGPVYFDLYFSARRAEQIINYLVEKGVEKSALSIIGLGDQFPYAKNVINGEIAGFSTKLNRRIDLIIFNGQQYNLKFNYSDGGLGEEYVDEKQTTLRNLLEDVSFKTQIKEATQVYKDEVLKNNEHPIIEKFAKKNSYYYSVGWSKSFSEMQRLSDRLKEQDYTNASVVPYFQGNRLDEEGVKRLVGQYSELKKYLIQLNK